MSNRSAPLQHKGGKFRETVVTRPDVKLLLHNGLKEKVLILTESDCKEGFIRLCVNFLLCNG